MTRFDDGRQSIDEGGTLKRKSAFDALSLLPKPAFRGNGARSTGPCRIHLVRHGRTVLNVQVRFRGRLEIPLDEQGKREAWLAARNLASADIAAVYTSPLGRAREVAQAIATVTSTAVFDHPGFLNLDYGRWEGMTKQECARRDPELWHLYRTAPEQAVCPGGEALAEAGDRVMEALRFIGDQHAGEAVAAVTHGVMVRLAILRVQPQPEWEVPLATGSSVVFEVKDGQVSLAPDVALPGETARVGAATRRVSESAAFAS
jgi:broad specificity phosphatase PhoE